MFSIIDPKPGQMCPKLSLFEATVRVQGVNGYGRDSLATPILGRACLKTPAKPIIAVLSI